MSTFNLLKYLEKRQLGYNDITKNVQDDYLDSLCFTKTPSHSVTGGNTFACKFSKNQNNLHLVASSSEMGRIDVLDTYGNPDHFQKRTYDVHRNAIFDIAWAEPSMKLVTACGDHTSKVCNLRPDGQLVEEKIFYHDASVKSVMFSPGSSDIFCSGSSDGTVFVWDTRINRNKNVLLFETKIFNSHGLYGQVYKSRLSYGISCVIFRNNTSVISCSIVDSDIKVWDMRRSYCKIKPFVEPLSVKKFHHGRKLFTNNTGGFTDMVLNPQDTDLYASSVDCSTYRYALDSTESMPFCKYTGYKHETHYSKISLSNDGRYLFTGCMEKSGVIWLTDFPYKEMPDYQIYKRGTRFNGNVSELSSSNWCLDSSKLKLATCCDSDIMVWTMHSEMEKQDCHSKTEKTKDYKPKSFQRKYHTIPKNCGPIEMRERETNLENWDTVSENNVRELKIVPKPRKNCWSAIFETGTNNAPQSPPVETTITIEPHVFDNIPEKPVPVTSKKRKNSSISPRGKIDYYFPRDNKREKLDGDTEKQS